MFPGSWNGRPGTGMLLAIGPSKEAQPSRNMTVQSDFDFATSASEQPDEAAGESAAGDAKPACVALVPMARQAEWSHKPILLPAPDPSFVAQLIATAEQLPQTRARRRATTADALSAYGANRTRTGDAGLRTRQTA